MYSGKAGNISKGKWWCHQQNFLFNFMLSYLYIYNPCIRIIELILTGSVTNAFQKFLKESSRKPNKIWVDKGSEFYNRSVKSWLEKNNIEMYSTLNEGNSVVAGRFFRTLKNKIYKYMTLITRNMYIYKLDDIVNKYSNIYHSTIKMKSVQAHISTTVKELMMKMLNLKLVILLQYQNIKTFLQKSMFQIGRKKFL